MSPSWTQIKDSSFVLSWKRQNLVDYMTIAMSCADVEKEKYFAVVVEGKRKDDS